MVTTIKDGQVFANINDLKNWEHNPRSIKGNDFDRLKKQITDLGQHTPLLVDSEGVVYGGNMRLRAFKELGITDIWVKLIEGDEARKLQYALSSNDRAGFYDDDLLANLIPEYPDFEWSDYSVDLREPENLGDIIDRFTTVEEDEVPEVPTEAISKYGEVYQLGRHRLMCGDATKIEDVEKLMNGQKADMVLTDPPYGMFLDTDWSDIEGSLGSIGGQNHTKGNKYDKVIGDNEDWKDEFITTIFAVFKDCPEIFLFGADYYSNLLIDKEKGSWLVWDKRKESQEDAIGAEFELCWSKAKHKRRVLRHDWFGFLSSQNSKDAQNRVHPTQKPVTLMADILKQWGKDNDNVIDLFGGSGSTLIACEQTNRTCYMMELDSGYCDVIRKRYENLTKPKEVI